MRPGDDPLQMAELFHFVEDVQVWAKDAAGRYVWVNRAFLLNFTLGAGGPAAADGRGVLGKTDYDLSPAFLADQFRLDDEAVLGGHRVVDRIEQVTRPDGTPGWNLTNKIPLRDRRGRTVGTAGLTRPLPEGGGGGGGDAGASEFGAVLAHLRDHYHTPVSNARLARLAGMSVRTFERRFAATFHLSPQRYLRKVQLRMATRALVYTGRPMAAVAAGCGFGDQSHFTREFRAHFGCTPTAYRERYAGDAAAAPAAGVGGISTKIAAGTQDRRRRPR